MHIIQSNKIPEAGGHYSPCIEHNNLLYISGQLPFNPSTNKIPEGIQKQTEQVLKNIENILAVAKGDKNDVLQVRIYLVDIEHWGIVNEIYASFFKEHKPARCIVPVPQLHHGALLEVEATAVSS